MRYDFVHTVTHRRLLTETNKSPAAIGRRGMIASRYEQDQQNQLLARRRAFRVLCRSDLLSGSTIASVVRSEVLVPCAVYAGATSCQADRIDSSRVHLNSLRALARRKYAKEATILLRFMVRQRLEEWESRDGFIWLLVTGIRMLRLEQA